ncbi:restriction endonuclease subunit S [Moraxella lacunata]|uniref:Restriction endonuclease subunit S n=1 Tax=Moraxella lacunata TaxID=477 RepID=A0A1V4GPZ2_MORLA|nr:restriction endonuclease subunit S [Moraxella lacunata]OPH34401.1 restriction endonuclease subunit S [Moraxella lacunata]
MSEWQVQKLSDVIEIIGGGTPKRSEERYWNGDIDWLSVADFNNDFRFVTNSSEKITELGLKNSSTKLLQKGQLIISARGTVGCLAQLAKPMAFNQSCYGLNGIKDIIDNDFLYYFLKHNIGILKSKTHGSVFDTITRDTFEHIEINFPNLDKQKEIAEILGDFDKKIQLNTQTNQTLEAIAQAIFKSWFVDFDPVRAKAQALSEGKSEREANLSAMSVISGKAIEDLSQTECQELWEIAEAFPSELVENEQFGEVPKGWEISTIGESYNVIMGQSPSGETYNEQGNGTLFYQGRAEFGWRFPTPRLFTTNPKRMAKSNDILMSVRAPVGDLNVALENCCIGRGLCALSHKSGEFSFGFYQMKNLKSVLDVFNGEGTVFGSINQKDLKSIPVLNPHQEIIALFNKFIFDIDNKIKNNVKENQQLEKIRDLLLPKLLSGEMEL